VQLNILDTFDQTRILAFDIVAHQNYQDSDKNSDKYCHCIQQAKRSIKIHTSFAFNPYKSFINPDFHHLEINIHPRQQG
jgi:hypothetical protein